MDASINSNTAVTDYLGMPILRFFETWEAICAVLERKAQKRKQAEKTGKGGRRHRR